MVDVGQGILKVVREITGAARAHMHAGTPSLDTLPYGRSRFFTDREDVLATIHACFTSGQAFQQRHVLALSGMPCCGKTQIAVEYAFLHQEEYQALLWLDATSRHSLKEAIVSLAGPLSFLPQDRADEQHLFSALKLWLQQHDRWLVILDNLRDLQVLNLFVPAHCRGHVLLTTSSQATGDLASLVPVAPMAPDDCALFLLRRAKIIGEQASREGVSEDEYDQASQIVQALGGLTLALDQAGAYIEEMGYDLAGYLKLYREQRAMLLAHRGRFVYAHSDSVMGTLLLLFKEVDQECPRAVDLLRLCAFLSPDAIPREMIEHGVSALDKPVHILADVQVLHQAFATLLKFSLLQHRVGSTSLSMHRVVQTILIEDMMRMQRYHWASRAVRLLNRVFPEAEFENWPTCEKYFVQARTCAEHILTYRIKQKEAAQLLQRLGVYCYHRGYYQDAGQYLRTALDVYEQGRKTDQPAIAATLNSLALVYHKQGHCQEARAHYQRALQIREQFYGPIHETIAQTLNNLALVSRDEGNYQEAEAHYQRALSMHEQTLGLDHPDTAALLNNLAMVYEDQGKSALAESLYQRAFAIEEGALSADHPDRALSLNTQAMQCERQGRYTEAEALYQRALAIQERNGADRADIAGTFNNLADLYEVLGRYQEAEAFYQRALDIARQAFGPEHPEIARVLNNLGYVSQQQGQYQEAEARYQQALAVYEHTCGPDHHETATVLTNLGRLYCDMNQADLAEPLLRRGLALRERVFGQNHLDTCQSLSALAEACIHQRLYEQAEPLYRRFLAVIEHLLDPKDPDVALARTRLSFVLEHVSKPEDLSPLSE